jgi:hypothetical protein
MLVIIESLRACPIAKVLLSTIYFRLYFTPIDDGHHENLHACPIEMVLLSIIYFPLYFTSIDDGHHREPACLPYRKGFPIHHLVFVYILRLFMNEYQ